MLMRLNRKQIQGLTFDVIMTKNLVFDNFLDKERLTVKVKFIMRRMQLYSSYIAYIGGSLLYLKFNITMLANNYL